jgi:hypothetical protein
MSSDDHILSRVSIRSQNVNIEPTEEVSTTPLAQIGVGDLNSYEIPSSGTSKEFSSTDISNCWAPSSIVVALITIIILAVIFMIYMYIQTPSRQLFFGIANRSVDSQIDLSDAIYFQITIGFWMAIMVYIVFKIDSPTDSIFKVLGRHRSRSPNIPNTQNDIYILLGNLGLLLLSMISIVYLNNIFFMILFAIAAIVVLFAWRPRPSFALLALAEIILLTIYGLKFRSCSS